jgi:hypothetical protein
VKKKVRSKVSKLPLPKLQRKLWVVVRELAEKLYPKDCYTCESKNLTGHNCQLGHMIPKSVCGILLKYDIRQLRWQCSRCNIWGGGMGAEFVKRMMVREGTEYVEKIFQDRNSYVKPYEHYLFQLEKYKLMLEDLNAKKQA